MGDLGGHVDVVDRDPAEQRDAVLLVDRHGIRALDVDAGRHRHDSLPHVVEGALAGLLRGEVGVAGKQLERTTADAAQLGVDPLDRGRRGLAELGEVAEDLVLLVDHADLDRLPFGRDRGLGQLTDEPGLTGPAPDDGGGVGVGHRRHLTELVGVLAEELHGPGQAVGLVGFGGVGGAAGVGLGRVAPEVSMAAVSVAAGSVVGPDAPDSVLSLQAAPIRAMAAMSTMMMPGREQRYMGPPGKSGERHSARQEAS